MDNELYFALLLLIAFLAIGFLFNIETITREFGLYFMTFFLIFVILLQKREGKAILSPDSLLVIRGLKKTKIPLSVVEALEITTVGRTMNEKTQKIFGFSNIFSPYRWLGKETYYEKHSKIRTVWITLNPNFKMLPFPINLIYHTISKTPNAFELPVENPEEFIKEIKKYRDLKIGV